MRDTGTMFQAVRTTTDIESSATIEATFMCQFSCIPSEPSVVSLKAKLIDSTCFLCVCVSVYVYRKTALVVVPPSCTCFYILFPSCKCARLCTIVVTAHLPHFTSVHSLEINFAEVASPSKWQVCMQM